MAARRTWNVDRAWNQLAARGGPVLLSFERPARESPGLRPRRSLKTAFVGQTETGPFIEDPWRDHRVPRDPNHRQDSKGTWWMPWHQESMKGVDGCDKPR
jgi:hypothetical protein